MLKRVAILACLVSASTANGQWHAEKQLHRLNDASSLFVSLVPENAGTSASASADSSTGNWSEGGASVRFDYSFLAVPGGFVEGFWNDPLVTLDLSFAPYGLSLYAKGSTADTVRLMLFEDHDMDGDPFEAGDEVFASLAQSLFSSFSQLVFPLTSFSLYAGTGDATLNLDRIGAWRIAIGNASGTAHAGQVWVDDLRQLTTYVPYSAGSDLLSGAFFQLWNMGAGCSCGQWSLAQWNAHLSRLRDMCEPTIFIQYGIWEDTAWYEPSSLPFVTYTNPTMARIFANAESLGMHVVVGLYFSEDWHTADKTNTSTYSDLLTRHRAVIDEVWDLFGTSPAFAGWYIPQEIEDLSWPNGSPQQGLLANWLEDVASYAKSKDASKSVYIAPYFSLFRPADDLETWYTTVLSTATDVDVVLVQDGVGTTRIDGDVDVPHYFNAIADACASTGRTFGAVVETFQQTRGWPVSTGDFAAAPAAASRVESQLWEAAATASQLVQFEYSYMQSTLGNEEDQLYRDYRAYQTAVMDCAPAAPVCPASPRVNCEAAGRGSLKIRDDSPDACDALVWKWTRGPALTASDFGDPYEGTTRYVLCVYDYTADVPSLKAEIPVPASGICSQSLCWKPQHDLGWLYKDRARSSAGVYKLQLKGGDVGKSKVILTAKGENMQLPSPVSGSKMLDADSQVVAQLIGDAPRCFATSFSGAQIRRNTPSSFTAQF